MLGTLQEDPTHSTKDIQDLTADNNIHNLRHKRRIADIPEKKTTKKRSRMEIKKSAYINLAGTLNMRGAIYDEEKKEIICRAIHTKQQMIKALQETLHTRYEIINITNYLIYAVCASLHIHNLIA